MGRPTGQSGASIGHFSHPHSMTLATNPARSSSCAACELQLADLPAYSCTPCRFHLHAKCGELPRQIIHPSHEHHRLNLIPPPSAIKDGHFKCDACGKKGRGFSYHCGHCQIFLHTICANKATPVSHPSHPQHQLHLIFSDRGDFKCRICERPGSNCWRYCCKLCGFNAHMKCVSKKHPDPGSNNFDRPDLDHSVDDPLISQHHADPNQHVANPSTNLDHDALHQILAGSSANPEHAAPVPPANEAMSTDLYPQQPVDGFGPSYFPQFDPTPAMFPGYDPSAMFNPFMFSGYDPSAMFGANPFMFTDPSIMLAIHGYDPSMANSLCTLPQADVSGIAGLLSLLGSF